MFTRRKNTRDMVLWALVGGAVGSAATLLFTPVPGDELRGEIKNQYDDIVGKAKVQSDKIVGNARTLADDITSRANHLFSITKDYTAGKYTGTADTFTAEYNRIKNAITAAVDAYNNYDVNEMTSEDIVDEIFEDVEDEGLPKSEGMGRRT